MISSPIHRDGLLLSRTYSSKPIRSLWIKLCSLTSQAHIFVRLERDCMQRIVLSVVVIGVGMIRFQEYKAAQPLVDMVKTKFNSNPMLMDKHCYDCALFYLQTAFQYKQIAQGQDIGMDASFMDKLKLLPPVFKSKFKM
eukprot:385972_1